MPENLHALQHSRDVGLDAKKKVRHHPAQELLLSRHMSKFSHS